MNKLFADDTQRTIRGMRGQNSGFQLVSKTPVFETVKTN
jgi:hypothetical protein